MRLVLKMVPNSKWSRLDLICSSSAQLRRHIHTAFEKEDEVFGLCSFSEAEANSAGLWVCLQGIPMILTIDAVH